MYIKTQDKTVISLIVKGKARRDRTGKDSAGKGEVHGQRLQVDVQQH